MCAGGMKAWTKDQGLQVGGSMQRGRKEGRRRPIYGPMGGFEWPLQFIALLSLTCTASFQCITKWQDGCFLCFFGIIALWRIPRYLKYLHVSIYSISFFVLPDRPYVE